ncbi:hypothetical protein [Tardiphaga sp.]|nr:hypothetical protein [Tardiphaga sp.]MDB5621066.1 hypothetical protein [Tardiphaga sp.]
MRHIDVAMFATATAFLVALIVLMPTKARPASVNGATASIFTPCKVIR